jgi:hypothetical protein
MSIKGRYAAVIYIFLLAAGAARAEEPKGVTWHSLVATAHAENVRTMSDDYRRVGKRDPRWDAAAVAFLDRMAARFANGVAWDWYALPGDHSPVSLLKLADEVVSKGCDDPLVLYCRAALLNDQKTDDAVPALLVAVPALLDSGYAPLRKHHAALRYSKLHFTSAPNDQPYIPLHTRCVQEWPVLLLDALKAKPVDPLELRLRFANVIDAMGEDLDQFRSLVETYEKDPAADPWLAKALRGDLEIDLAWKSRGGGFANTVSEAGWAGFGQHLRQARDALAAADAMRPEFPEPAASMITVGKGAGGELGVDPRQWFDKAVIAQIDYMPAWLRLRDALQPRWGGSEAAMFRLGLQALDTKRFDTALPNFFIDTVDDLSVRQGRGEVAYLEFEAWPHLARALDGYIAGDLQTIDRDYLRSRKAALAYHCTEFAVAARLLDELGDRAQPRAFEYHRLHLDEVRHECYALATDRKRDVQDALTLSKAGDFAKAAAAWSDFLKTIPLDHAARPLAERHLRLATTGLAFARGEPAALSLDAGADRHAWNVNGPAWPADDGAVAVSPPGRMTYALAPPQDRRTTVEFYYDGEGPLKPARLDVKLQIGHVDRIIGLSVWPAQGSMRMTSQGKVYLRPPAPVDLPPRTWHTLAIEQQGETIRVSLNGKRVFEETSGWVRVGTPIAGLACGERPIPGVTMKVRGLKVEPLP